MGTDIDDEVDAAVMTIKSRLEDLTDRNRSLENELAKAYEVNGVLLDNIWRLEHAVEG
jgi:prefoldin subunit 5